MINQQTPELATIEKQKYEGKKVDKVILGDKPSDAKQLSYAPGIPPPGKGKYAKAKLFYVDPGKKDKKFPKVKFYKNGRRWMLLFGEN